MFLNVDESKSRRSKTNACLSVPSERTLGQRWPTMVRRPGSAWPGRGVGRRARGRKISSNGAASKTAVCEVVSEVQGVENSRKGFC